MVDEAIQMDIKLYTTPTWGYCHQAKSYLGERGVEYTEYDVSRDRVAAEEMVRLTGQMGVPVIVVNDEAIIGFDRARLQALLSKGNGRKPPRLGLKVTDASTIKRKPGEPPLLGAVVGAVAPFAPGERAGIRVGDIVTSINRKRINNTVELEESIRTLSPGTRVPITYYRGEQAIKSELTL